MNIEATKTLLKENYDKIINNLDNVTEDNLPSIRDDLLSIQQHIDNLGIHTNSDTKKDNEYHILDKDIHVTPEDKAKWNDIASNGLKANNISIISNNSTGSKIASITVNGDTTDIYAAVGEGTGTGGSAIIDDINISEDTCISSQLTMELLKQKMTVGSITFAEDYEIEKNVTNLLFTGGDK